MPTSDGELLTPDEQLQRIPRWTGPVTDLKTAFRNMAKAHWPDNMDIDEDEEWDMYLDELVMLWGQTHV